MAAPVAQDSDGGGANDTNEHAFNNLEKPPGGVPLHDVGAEDDAAGPTVISGSPKELLEIGRKVLSVIKKLTEKDPDRAKEGDADTPIFGQGILGPDGGLAPDVHDPAFVVDNPSWLLDLPQGIVPLGGVDVPAWERGDGNAPNAPIRGQAVPDEGDPWDRGWNSPQFTPTSEVSTTAANWMALIGR